MYFCVFVSYYQKLGVVCLVDKILLARFWCFCWISEFKITYCHHGWNNFRTGPEKNSLNIYIIIIIIILYHYHYYFICLYNLKKYNLFWKFKKYKKKMILLVELNKTCFWINTYSPPHTLVGMSSVLCPPMTREAVTWQKRLNLPNNNPQYFCFVKISNLTWKYPANIIEFLSSEKKLYLSHDIYLYLVNVYRNPKICNQCWKNVFVAENLL